MAHDQFITRLRPAALTAGPVAVISLLLLIAAIVTAGSDVLAIERSPLAVASSVAGLAALVLLTFGALRLALLYDVLRSGAGLMATAVAITGTLLAAGGQWTLVFVVPGLAEAAPETIANGITSVLTGYVISFVTFAAGWAMLAVVLLRSQAPCPRWVVWMMLAGALLAVAPLPARFFLLALAVSLLEYRRNPAVAPTPALT